ncbi:hypothetical protein KIL84_009018 [Mauremys mutica]|uniref:Uncharacterized protein n=1 Tax=Mauremys mutica TaxID=74926 RepID=A0A9D3XI82_9SAUR|nr:hypothetical protein KIL84_009018 [Mauremys mutica]
MVQRPAPPSDAAAVNAQIPTCPLSLYSQRTVTAPRSQHALQTEPCCPLTCKRQTNPHHRQWDCSIYSSVARVQPQGDAAAPRPTPFEGRCMTEGVRMGAVKYLGRKMGNRRALGKKAAWEL